MHAAHQHIKQEQLQQVRRVSLPPIASLLRMSNADVDMHTGFDCARGVTEDKACLGDTCNHQSAGPSATTPSSASAAGTETTFICPAPACGRSFDRAFKLKSHMAVHAGKRLPCPFCDQPFARRHDLYRHARSIHSPSRPLVCRVCLAAFDRPDLLARHLAASRHDPAPLTPTDRIRFAEAQRAIELMKRSRSVSAPLPNTIIMSTVSTASNGTDSPGSDSIGRPESPVQPMILDSHHRRLSVSPQLTHYNLPTMNTSVDPYQHHVVHPRRHSSVTAFSRSNWSADAVAMPPPMPVTSAQTVSASPSMFSSTDSSASRPSISSTSMPDIDAAVMGLSALASAATSHLDALSQSSSTQHVHFEAHRRASHYDIPRSQSPTSFHSTQSYVHQQPSSCLPSVRRFSVAFSDTKSHTNQPPMPTRYASISSIPSSSSSPPNQTLPCTSMPSSPPITPPSMTYTLHHTRTNTNTSTSSTSSMHPYTTTSSPTTTLTEPSSSSRFALATINVGGHV